MVTTEDLFPTIMEMTGVSYDTSILDGLSLMPVLKQKGTLSRNTLYWHYPHYHHLGYKPSSAIREGDYKLIEWFEETLRNEPNQVSLFNLREDIGESKDLSAQMPDKVEHLRQKLHEWRRSVGAQEMSVNPNYDPKRADLRFSE
jgi:arylsulfatase A